MNEAAAPLKFDVQVATPDLSPWRAGNTGIAGVTSYLSSVPGPHVALVALTHGNEIAGAVALDRLLRAGLRPRRGRLSLVFHNLEAFDRFDPANPTASRYCDEDLNRVWAEGVLDGPRQSREIDRARVLRPLVDDVDVLLDLHSMLWPSDPVTLCGQSARGRDLALAVGGPDVVVADRGHDSGRRIIDYTRFTDPSGAAVALLVEAGQHWAATTVDMTQATVDGLLRHFGMVDTPPAPPAVARFAEVTEVVTARGADFAFLRPFRGGEVIRRRNTLIALDGDREIRTQYDNCLLVMPSLRPTLGHTCVRLARFVDARG